MFAQSARFFRLPLEDKVVLHVKKSPHLVGYVGMKEENADPAVSKGDIHEGFDFIAEDVETATGFLEGDFRKAGNQWPANLSGFREVMTEYTIAVRLLVIPLQIELLRLLFLALLLPTGITFVIHSLRELLDEVPFRIRGRAWDGEQR